MIDWAEVTALCAGFGMMGTIFLFTTRAIVRDEIRKINGTYVRSKEAEIRFKQIEDHFDYLRDQREKDIRERSWKINNNV
jgi:hypothetical protein